MALNIRLWSSMANYILTLICGAAIGAGTLYVIMRNSPNGLAQMLDRLDRKATAKKQPDMTCLIPPGEPLALGRPPRKPVAKPAYHSF